MSLSCPRLQENSRKGKKVMCGYSGYDFIILDTEHGPMSAETCIPMICAAERTGMVPVIRVSENEKNYVLRALDVGGNGNHFSHD